MKYSVAERISPPLRRASPQRERRMSGAILAAAVIFTFHFPLPVEAAGFCGKILSWISSRSVKSHPDAQLELPLELRELAGRHDAIWKRVRTDFAATGKITLLHREIAPELEWLKLNYSGESENLRKYIVTGLQTLETEGKEKAYVAHYSSLFKNVNSFTQNLDQALEKLSHSPEVDYFSYLGLCERITRAFDLLELISAGKRLDSHESQELVDRLRPYLADPGFQYGFAASHP